MSAVYRHVRMKSARKGGKKREHRHNWIWTGLTGSQTQEGRQANPKICIRKLLQTPIPPYRNQPGEK